MKLAILKTDAVRPEWVPQFGEYPDMFIALLRRVDPHLAFRVYDVESGQYPADIDEADAYLITGSQSSAYEDKPWIDSLATFARKLHVRRKKLVGIYFGHQLVAQALGGEVIKSPKGWGVGLHTHRFTLAPPWHDQGHPEFLSDYACELMMFRKERIGEPAYNAGMASLSRPHEGQRVAQWIINFLRARQL